MSSGYYPTHGNPEASGTQGNGQKTQYSPAEIKQFKRDAGEDSSDDEEEGGGLRYNQVTHRSKKRKRVRKTKRRRPRKSRRRRSRKN
jgi:hypothetical protein